jgi:hypothetical protein
LYANERNGFTYNFEHVTPWTHPNGTNTLFCESRSWDFGPSNRGIGEYILIDIDSKKIQYDWRDLLASEDIGGEACITNNTA